MFVPVVVGSDKTTVSVATGHQEYHPVYMSPRNLTNIARRAHGNALLPIMFLPIPKSKSLVYDKSITLIWTESNISHQETPEKLKVSSLLQADVPHLPSPSFPTSQGGDDYARGCQMSWWSFPSSYLWAWTLYCGLSRAGLVGGHRARMVPKVSLPLYLLFAKLSHG